MAAKSVAAIKTLGPLFSREEVVEQLQWDFSKDGGATTDTYRLALTGAKILIQEATVQVETACTSGGAATLSIGVEGGDVDAFLDVTSGAVASLTDDALVRETAGQSIVVASGAYLTAVIADAAMTAGKVNLFIRYRQIV